MSEKMIGGFPVSKWRKAFALAVNIAIDQDYFSDTLFYDLYPNIHEEAVALGLGDDEEANDDLYNAKWDYVDEAFKEVFGIDREQAWRLEED